MADIQIQIKNIDQIRAAFTRSPAVMTKNLNRAIRQTIMFVRGESQKNAPVRTGYLRGSVYTDYEPLRGEIGYKAKYAGFVHDGTAPYTIVPTTKKALFWKGAAHPMRSVRHPGIKANPFLQRAVDSSEPTIDKFFADAVDDTFDQLAKESG
jgi:HK97 gp10 family phage protein